MIIPGLMDEAHCKLLRHFRSSAAAPSTNHLSASEYPSITAQNQLHHSLKRICSYTIMAINKLMQPGPGISE